MKYLNSKPVDREYVKKKETYEDNFETLKKIKEDSKPKLFVDGVCVLQTDEQILHEHIRSKRQEAARNYNARHYEELKIKRRAWYEKNRDRLLLMQRESGKLYYQQNREKLLQKAKDRKASKKLV